MCNHFFKLLFVFKQSTLERDSGDATADRFIIAFDVDVDRCIGMMSSANE